MGHGLSPTTWSWRIASKPRTAMLPQFSEAFYEAVAAQASESPSIVYDRQEALLHCLEELDEGKRRLVQRYYGGKESKEELARTLKRSYEALRKAIYRTLLSLSNCVNAPAKGDGEMSNENTPRSGLKEEIHLLAHGALFRRLRGHGTRFRAADCRKPGSPAPVLRMYL